jgi:hypothetical protein
LCFLKKEFVVLELIIYNYSIFINFFQDLDTFPVIKWIEMF